MEKKEKKIGKLAKKIYLLTYGKPRYKLEISNMIYDRENKVIYPEIKKLEKYNWIKKTSRPKDADTKKAGKRSNKRQYYCANAKPLFDSILWDLEEKNISLTSKEKESLTRYLDGKSFRATVRKITVEDGKLRSKSLGFSTVKRNLCYNSVYMVFVEDWILGHAFLASPAVMESIMSRITHPVFTLGASLCKKLTCLDFNTSFIALSSFRDVQEMIESTFKPVLKDNMIKLDKATREKILEENKDQPGIWVDLEKREIKYIEKRKAKQRAKERQVESGKKYGKGVEKVPQPIKDKSKARDKGAK